MGELIMTNQIWTLIIYEYYKKKASPIRDKIYQNYFQSKFWHRSQKTRPCQILRGKMYYESTYLSGLNHWTKGHSVFCHVVYSITEPVISSQGQRVISFQTTKRQWQIHWSLSLELNTFITTKTALHLLPTRPLQASTITHTSLATSMNRIPLLKTSWSALSFRAPAVVHSGLWLYWL